jgi:diguanylate cyclase (GGDEF)-like protein
MVLSNIFIDWLSLSIFSPIQVIITRMASISIDLTLIQKTELFSTLSGNEIDFVVSNSETLTLPKNGSLFSSGEKASRFYILTSGDIRVFKRNSDGSEDEMAHFTSGDTIGDFDFARGAEYDANAEAAEDSQLIVFPARGLTMDLLAQKDSGIVCSILLNAIVMMTGRIKSANKLVVDNMSWVQDIHRRAYEDAGTGLWKQTLIADEIAGNLKEPAALIMLKPDNFKILVDSRGHSVGDEAMIRIGLILKNITRIVGHGWPMRFKSNETGLIFNNCDAAQAKAISETLAKEISRMEPAPARGENPEFRFSATISWCIWSKENADWESLFQGNYACLLDNWKAGGNRIVHYIKEKKT